MSVAEFLAWPRDGTGRTYELVEGELRAQDAACGGHGTIQGQLVYLLAAHLRMSRPGCRVVTAPGIQPHLRANRNHRIPEIAVTCTPHRSGAHITPNPILIVEVPSPSNASDTWNNVALFAMLPSVTEILVIEAETVGAQLLRHNADGTWPDNPQEFRSRDELQLASIDLTFPLAEAYRDTDLV